MSVKISQLIIDWFRKESRELPWRQTRDPYPIWLSEVILQQTRVQQGISYYLRFIEKYPRVSDLAAASEEEVLSLWQGLGYYSRGRNLLVTAQQIVRDYNGEFPLSSQELKKLKGIGPYTAAAIAAFAFGEKVAAIDGNVIRVVCRLYALQEDIRLPSLRKKTEILAHEMMPENDAWTFNQAMMEFGALLCTPSNPQCIICPVAEHCESRKKGLQSSIPYKSKAAPRKKRYFNYLLAECNGQMAFRCRDEKDIWLGLFEPHLTESNSAFSSAGDFLKGNPDLTKNLLQFKLLPAEKCILSHQEIVVTILICSFSQKPELAGFRWVSEAEMEQLPKPVIFSKILPKASSAPLYLGF